MEIRTFPIRTGELSKLVSKMPARSGRLAPKNDDGRNPTLFWETIRKIRTNAFEYNDDVAHTPLTYQNRQLQQNQRQRHLQRQRQRRWAFRTHKSHILDTNGHYAWKRELNCFQGQSLPDAIFPLNTLEITMDMALARSGDEDSEDGNGDDNSDDKECLRIRFGALEGLRGWMSLDSEPIPTTHARDNAYWKGVAAQDQLSNTFLLGRGSGEGIIASTSYDYAYTTPYKGGTDTIITTGTENKNHDNPNSKNGNYDYLHADSSSFVPKHDMGANDMVPAAGGAGIKRVKVKLRKPICKCKGDGGRAPFVASTNNNTSNNRNDANGHSPPRRTNYTPAMHQKHTRPPQWTSNLFDPGYRVDIEGLLFRNGRRPFLFREDVDLWQDDLHDNGTAWLKARCFVCQEGWACLLRNFVRVDGVLCRVVDTRYIHAFGTSMIYREHSWREGPWDPLVRAIQRDNATTNTQSTFGQHAINDSVAARYLPLTKPSRTECLSLLEEKLSPTFPAAGSVLECVNSNRHQHQLIMINDETIEDAIHVPNFEVENKLGISFVLKRSKRTVLEAISSSRASNGRGNDGLPVSTLWSKAYSNSDSESTKPQAMVLSVQISPDSTDGGRLAIGDDRGKVEVWRLSTGVSLWSFPVAPSSILTRLEKNPNFQSARLWVDHLAWSDDGSMIGASAGRNTVLASASTCKIDEMSETEIEIGRIISYLENSAGTVTGLAFRNHIGGHPVSLAVASYGAVCWLTVPSPSKQKLNIDDNGQETLKREGAAVECIDISPDGERVAVGFLDKTLRVFTMDIDHRSIPTAATITTATPTMPSFASRPSKDDRIVDWVGFNAAVKSVQFNPKGKWLAAMGGNAILVIKNSLSPRTEAPIVCRTPGKTEADGGDGTCHKFEGIKWSNEKNNNTAALLLAALDAKTGSVHVFLFSNDDHHQDVWPIRAVPVLTVFPTFRRPSTFATTKFAFFLNSGQKQEDKEVAFLVLDRSANTADNDSLLHQELGTKLLIDNSADAERFTEGSADKNDEQFSFRTLLQ